MRHAICKILLVGITALLSLPAFAANDTALYYWIGFKDKEGTAFTTSQPEQYLSQRAIERRQRLHIAIDSLDLPVCQQYIDAITATGAVRHNTTKWLNGMTVIADSQTADSISRLPFVKEVMLYCRRDVMADTATQRYDAGSMPDTHSYERYDSNYYNLSYNHINMLNGMAMHRNGYEGQGVWIGVCDGGFPGVDSHSVFRSMLNEHRLIATRDFTIHSPSVFCLQAHGTKVLSTMAADLPGEYVGTAPKASYVLCITEDGPTESPIEELNWACAAEYMDSIGVDVITSSLGYNSFDDSTLNHIAADFDGKTTFISRAAAVAASRGILCVNSAANNGNKPGHPINVPADTREILTVGATWHNGYIASFSSWGPTADGRIKPDVVAQGVYNNLASPLGGYLKGNGTSFATPIVAGMVACLRQAMPTASVSQMWNAIRLSADRALHANNIYGYGIPDFYKALQLLKADVYHQPLYDTVVAHDTVVEPVIIEKHHLTVSSTNVDCGVAAGNGNFANGTAVEIAAIPIEGYRFYSWTDGDTNNPRIVVVESDTTFTADFQYYGVGIAATNVPDYEATVKGGTILLQGAAGQRMRLFDAVGRLIKEEQNAANMLQLAVPATGVYLLQVAEWPARRITIVR